MKAYPADFAWLDSVRSPNEEGEKGLRELAQLWVIGHEVRVDETIRGDLSPFPDIQPDTARLLLRDRVNTFLETHEVTPRVTDTKERGVAVTLTFISFLDRAVMFWHGFLRTYTGWRQESTVQACVHCGKAFVPQRQGAKYCSDSCRVGAHQKRKREAQS